MVKFEPVMVTIVPPAAGPTLGETEVTVGAGRLTPTNPVPMLDEHTPFSRVYLKLPSPEKPVFGLKVMMSFRNPVTVPPSVPPVGKACSG